MTRSLVTRYPNVFSRSCSTQIPQIGWMVVVALCLRLAVVALVYNEQLSSEDDHFAFGWELGRVARSLVQHHGFSSPLGGQTGPTAWLPPVFVAIVSGLFRIFGVYSAPAAISALSINALFSALTVVPLVFIASKIFGAKTALYAGWMWVLFPYAIMLGATRIWGETLDAALVAALLLRTMHFADGRGKLWQAMELGALAGLAVLTNPNTMAFLPALWIAACYMRMRKGCPWSRQIASASAALVLVLTPWFIRNTLVMNRFLPLRSNFWLEAYVGNNLQAVTLLVDWNRHPASSIGEHEEYVRLGELAYMQRKHAQTLDFVSAHPGIFTLLTLRRMLFVWTGFWSFNPRYLATEPFRLPFIAFNTSVTLLTAIGLFTAWRRCNPYRLFLTIPILFQPVVYYVTHAAPEYRHAIDPIIVLLAAQGALSLPALRSFAVRLRLTRFKHNASWARGNCLQQHQCSSCPTERVFQKSTRV